MPATLEYQRHLVDSLPAMPAGAGTPPIDVKSFTSSVTAISVMLGLAGGIVFLSAWPIVLYVWAGQLIRETLAPDARRA